MKKYWLILFALLIPSWAFSATRYVDLNCGDISTYNPTTRACTGGTTVSRNTIAEGIALTLPGDILFIRAGLYLEAPIRADTTTFNSGSSFATCPAGSTTCSTAPIISGYQNERPIIRWGLNFKLSTTQYMIFRNFIIDGDSQPFTAGINMDAHHIRFEGLEIRFNIDDGIATHRGSHHIEVLNCNIHHNGNPAEDKNHGLYWVGSDSLLDGNVIHNNAGLGIQIQDADLGFGSHRNIFRNNTVHSNRFQGIFVDGQDNQIYNNVVYGNQYQGIHLAPTNGIIPDVTRNLVYGNTVYNNAGGGIYMAFTSYAVTFGNTVRNNIVYNNEPTNMQHPTGATNWAGSNTYSNNLCNTIEQGCTVAGNPQFASAQGGDFRIASAGSPAVNAGFTLASPWNVDIEDKIRPAGQFTIGAYQFGTAVPAPGPFGNLVRYKFDEGSGLAAADSETGTGTGGHTCTFTSAGWVQPGIIGPAAASFNGTRYCSTPGATLKPTTAAGLSIWLLGTTTSTNGGILATVPNDAFQITMGPDGTLKCEAFDGQWRAVSGPIGSGITGTETHVSCSYKQGDGMRLRINNVSAGFRTMPDPLSYANAGAGTLRIGSSDLSTGFYTYTGVLDQFYMFDQDITDQANTNLFNERVPTQVGINVAHSRFSVASLPEGTFVAGLDQDHTIAFGRAVGVRWALRKPDAGALTEFYPIFCRTLIAGAWGEWTQVFNSFFALGVRYFQDPAVSLGQATTVLFPTEGFTGIPGKFLENPVDTIAPYDAIQRLTLNQNQHAELEARLEFGAPLQGGDCVQCRPQREAGEAFAGGYGGLGEPAIRTLTLEGVEAPLAARLGGIVAGGVQQ